jgi:hypothetical protein
LGVEVFARYVVRQRLDAVGVAFDNLAAVAVDIVAQVVVHKRLADTGRLDNFHAPPLRFHYVFHLSNQGYWR